MLLQTEQRRNLALTSRTAAANASASWWLERRMWNASLCALLAPTPGSFLSSSIRRDMGSANLDMERIVQLWMRLFVTPDRETILRFFLIRVREAPSRPAFRPRSIASAHRFCDPP